MVMNLLPRPALNILSSLTSSPPRPSPVGESLLHHDDDDDDGVGDDGHGDGDGDKQHKTMQSWKTWLILDRAPTPVLFWCLVWDLNSFKGRSSAPKWMFFWKKSEGPPWVYRHHFAVEAIPHQSLLHFPTNFYSFCHRHCQRHHHLGELRASAGTSIMFCMWSFVSCSFLFASLTITFSHLQNYIDHPWP